MKNKLKKESEVFVIGVHKLMNDYEHQHRSQMIKRGIHISSLRKENEKNKGHIIKTNKIISK
jgi:hypothetical protein